VDKIAEGRFHSAADCIRAALTDLETATKLDAEDLWAAPAPIPTGISAGRGTGPEPGARL
jgi:Arc/MetJ-type ribon-helix-helix transcriptional regulator